MMPRPVKLLIQPDFRSGMVFSRMSPEEDIRKFITKWDLHPENDSCEYFTQEQQMQIDLDNPLCLDFIPRLELNGKTMLTSHGCSVVFNPCLPDGVINEAEAKWALEHYDLDTSYGWMIFRAAFPWTSKRRPEIKALSLTMEQQSCRVPGPHFKAHAPGDSFSFLHPAQSVERNKLHEVFLLSCLHTRLRLDRPLRR